MPVFDDVDEAWQTANTDRWEGIVYKRTASRWRAGERSNDWRKRKVWRTTEFVVTSYRETDGRLDAIGIAREVDGVLERCATVESFGAAASRSVFDELFRPLALFRSHNGW